MDLMARVTRAILHRRAQGNVRIAPGIILPVGMRQKRDNWRRERQPRDERPCFGRHYGVYRRMQGHRLANLVSFARVVDAPAIVPDNELPQAVRYGYNADIVLVMFDDVPDIEHPRIHLVERRPEYVPQDDE